jgi:hypothetical protein
MGIGGRGLIDAIVVMIVVLKLLGLWYAAPATGTTTALGRAEPVPADGQASERREPTRISTAPRR